MKLASTGLLKILSLSSIIAVGAALGVAQAATVKDPGLVFGIGARAPTINTMILGYGTNPVYDKFVTFGLDISGAPATTFKIDHVVMFGTFDGLGADGGLDKASMMKLGSIWSGGDINGQVIGGMKKAKGTTTVLGSIGDTAEYSASPTTKVQVSTQIISDAGFGAKDPATVTTKTTARATG